MTCVPPLLVSVVLRLSPRPGAGMASTATEPQPQGLFNPPSPHEGFLSLTTVLGLLSVEPLRIWGHLTEVKEELQ